MRKRKSTEANRERIILTATRLIRERGIDNTTLADIANAAEISKGTLYYYYASKGDLIFDIAERHIDNMTERIFGWLSRSSSAQNPRTVFRMVMDTVMRSRNRGHIHVYLIKEALTESPHLQARFVAAYARRRAMIQEGLQQVYGSTDEYATLSRVLLAMIDGLVLQRLLGVRDLAVDDIAVLIEAAGSAITRSVDPA